MEIETSLALFRDMVGCCHNLYLWTYDSGFHLISSNCPEQTAVNDLFLMGHRRKEFDQQVTANRTPIIFTNDVGHGPSIRRGGIRASVCARPVFCG